MKCEGIYMIYAGFRDDEKPFPYCIPCQDPYKGKGMALMSRVTESNRILNLHKQPFPHKLYSVDSPKFYKVSHLRTVVTKICKYFKKL